MLTQLVKFDDITSIRIVWFEGQWSLIAEDIVTLCGYEYVEASLKRYCDKERSRCLIDTFNGKILMETVNLIGAQRLVTNSPLADGDKEQVSKWFSEILCALLKEPVGNDTFNSCWEFESIRLMYLSHQENLAGVPDDYWRDAVSQDEIVTQMIPDKAFTSIYMGKDA